MIYSLYFKLISWDFNYGSIPQQWWNCRWYQQASFVWVNSKLFEDVHGKLFDYFKDIALRLGICQLTSLPAHDDDGLFPMEGILTYKQVHYLLIYHKLLRLAPYEHQIVRFS